MDPVQTKMWVEDEVGGEETTCPNKSGKTARVN